MSILDEMVYFGITYRKVQNLFSAIGREGRVIPFINYTSLMRD